MSDFKAKMHQNRFRLGLCPRPRWGILQRPLRPDRFPSWNKGYLLLREEEGCREGTRMTERGRQGTVEKGSEGRGPFKVSLEELMRLLDSHNISEYVTGAQQ